MSPWTKHFSQLLMQIQSTNTLCNEHTRPTDVQRLIAQSNTTRNLFSTRADHYWRHQSLKAGRPSAAPATLRQPHGGGGLAPKPLFKASQPRGPRPPSAHALRLPALPNHDKPPRRARDIYEPQNEEPSGSNDKPKGLAPSSPNVSRHPKDTTGDPCAT